MPGPTAGDYAEELQAHLRATGLKGLFAPRTPVTVASVEPVAEQGMSSLVYHVALEEPDARLILKVYKSREKARSALKEACVLRSLRREGMAVPLVYGTDIGGKAFGKPFLLLEEVRTEEHEDLLREGRTEVFAEAVARSLHLLHSLKPKLPKKLEPNRMSLDDEIRDLIMKRAGANIIKQAGIRKGMRILRDDGVRKILAGDTTVEEVLRVTQDDVVQYEG